MTPYRFHPARIITRRVDGENILTFALRFVDPELRRGYRFQPGQFNMLYAFGVGEVPISIVSDPDEPAMLAHTIRVVGRVTQAMERWKIGDVVGVRGPYGRGWPMDAARGRDVIVVTGGVGCAPVMGVINYVFRRRAQYGTLHILHGVKTSKDLLFRDQFDAWRQDPRTRVYLTTDRPDEHWRYHVGVVTNLFDELEVDRNAVVMMCGPEVMMRYAIRTLRHKGVRDDAIYVSLERHMQCAVGLCGHCQLAPHFVCKDGPVFSYDVIRRFFGAVGL